MTHYISRLCKLRGGDKIMNIKYDDDFRDIVDLIENINPYELNKKGFKKYTILVLKLKNIRHEIKTLVEETQRLCH